MQPIKTTNAMNPAPAKGIESFPTPVIDDVVISEVVNSWKGDYQPLEYGVLWKDVSHAPNQGSFPEHKLVFQQPTSEDGQWVKRIWVNDRVNQDSYNYAIKYSAGSQDHPIYIRTYIVPRETYAPLLDGTPDPLFPSALLVDEEAQRTEGELDSKYITVTRVYETIPGPEVPTRRYNERGDLETVIVQTVLPNTPPTADGLLVTQSQVEQVETGKGVKTTATVQDHALLQIKEKKEGLLGETITTDDIVDPSTNPDALSQTIVASTVEQYTATKARKRTTTASGPTSLSQKSKDGKLLGDITSIESIVAPNANPDAVSSAILSSEVKQVDSGKAIKRNVVLNSTPTLSGKQAEQGLLGVKSTVESIVPAGTPEDPLSLSVISSAVEPIDSVRSRKVTVSSLGPLTLSGGQKKDGLLGETNVSETIVAAGTQPDALSQSVVSSVVEPIDAAKSKKITITATGPTSITQRSKDGKLLGDVTITESVVSPNSLPDTPNSSILSSEVKQIDLGKAVKTNSVLNTIPTLLGGQTGEGLLGTKVTTETIVNSGTSPDPVSLNILSSQVEPIDSVRSRKVTTSSSGPSSLSGKQKKEGLLGETSIQESIVAAGSDPDELNTSVISSEVVAIDSAKSRKTTITSNGPKSLTTKSNDGKLLGNIEVTESVVAPSSNPDSLSGVTAGVIQSEVKQVDNGKAIKQTTRLLSTPQFSGQTKESGLLGEKTTTETIVAAGSNADNLSQSVLSSTVEQIDTQRSKKTTVTSTGPTSLVGKKINERGDVETITESIVGSGQGPDGDSFLQSSSEVVPVDSSKSRKTTSVVSGYEQLGQKQNSEGLLGKTVTTEDIVPASTNPDALSQTVLSSSVQKISKTKAVKKTTTAIGPTSLSGVENKDGLLGQTKITKSIVAANAPADAVSLEVISSVVEPIDDAKSQKTTITSSGPKSLTGKNNKPGLLGTTVVTKSIVAANSEPDNLSISVVESQVDPIDSAKSQKTTVLSSGPTSLTSRILADSPTGSVNATKTNFIVDPNQVPVNSLTTLKYDINAIDSAKSEAEIVEVTNWPEVRGVEFDDVIGLPIPYTEQVISPSEYNDAWEPFLNTNYKPIDEYKAVRKSYNTEEIQRYYVGYLSVIETPVQITLPDKLIDVTAYIARDYSEGKNVSDSNNVGGDSYGYTSGGGFRSAGSISADIYFKIEKGFDGYIDGMEVTLFVESSKIVSVAGNQVINTSTGEIYGDIPPSIKSVNANVLAELQERLPNEDIKLWPTLKKISQNILVFTGGKSKTTSSSNSEDVSINGFANSQRQDESYDIDTNVNSVLVPDALYESITIKEEKFGPIIPEDLQITGGVYPKTLPATNPAKFPIGNYLIRSDASIYRFGLVKITAVIARVTEDFV